MAEKITAGDILRLLQHKYNCTPERMSKLESGSRQEWLMATEVKNGCGYSFHRSLDVVVVNTYPSKGLLFEGIEIKVSKSDLRTELQNAEKHAVFFENLDYFSLACPASILDMDIIPKKWGVYVVNDKGELRTKRKPLALHDEARKTLTRDFTVAFIRAFALRGSGILHDNELYSKKISEEYQRGFESGKKSASSPHHQRRLDELKKFEEITGVNIGDWYGTEEQARLFKCLVDVEANNAARLVSDSINTLERVIKELKKSEKELKQFPEEVKSV